MLNAVTNAVTKARKPDSHRTEGRGEIGAAGASLARFSVGPISHTLISCQINAEYGLEDFRWEIDDLTYQQV